MAKSGSIFRHVLAGTVIALLVCAFAAFAGVRLTHTLEIPYDGTAEALIPDASDAAGFRVENGKIVIEVFGEGQAAIAESDELIVVVNCTANGFARDMISDRYTGDVWVHGSVLAFLAAVNAILFTALRRQMLRNAYDYGLTLLLALMLLAFFSLIAVLWKAGLPGNGALERALSGLPPMLLLYTVPAFLLFSLAMFFSNAVLMRHEGTAWRNMLGSILNLVLMAAIAFIALNSDVSGSLDEVQLHGFLINLFSGMVFWTECKLAAIILCGVRATKRQPAFDKDYVLILGCRLSKDGGLTPLLRGRVDRALEFARKQEKATGKMPVLIPCGGKGDDELRSEAAAMREYLLEKGVAEEDIIAEDRSATTWENIRNAKLLMKPGSKAAYATTNYHVFRAGVWAAKNGLQAESMGSRTKWYYWPNAFIREYAALIRAEWKHEAVTVLAIGIQSGVLAYLFH